MTSQPSLADVTWQLLTSAAELYQDSPRAARWLVGCLERLADPLRIAVAGDAGVGKSTLVNALAGEHIAPIEVGGGGVFAWYLDGAEPAAAVFPPGADAVPVPVTRRDRRLHLDLRQWQPEQVERVVVEWPARGLRDISLIDTPAGTSAEWLAGTVDAVVYATRDPSDADLALLRAAQAGDPTGAVTTILALTRADELGAGRIDALSSAKQIARRRRCDAAVHAVCQNVIAVAGLLGQTGRTLRDDEFAALRALAGMARAELDGHLLSADRFVTAELPVRLSADARVELLDRLGVFGIRLASTLIRRGADTRTALAGQLVQRSGLSDLRESIGSFFTDRADVLRARSALAGLNVVLRNEPRPRSGQLAAAAERTLAGAHDIAELRLLAGLRTGRLTLPGGLADAAERLTGGLGTGIADRLGLPADAGPDDVRNAVYDELGQWRAQAESPLLGAAQHAAARTVVRSCEGLLTTLAPPAYR